MIYTDHKAFDTIVNNLPVKLYTLKNSTGVKINICNYGARITHFILPKNGNEIDITLGFNSIEEYIDNNEFYYGVTVGRFANRIKDGRFVLNNQTYNLEANNGGNSLHSGSKAFHNSVWEVLDYSETAIKMKIISPDGQGGFPGQLTCEVVFTLNDEGELAINYSATTDKDTIVNITNHAYFNLNGEGNGTILNHNIKIEFISASNKLKDFLPKETDGKMDYKQRKKLGIKTCLNFVNTDERFKEWDTFVNKHSKKDDLSDCFLQGLWYIKHKI